MNHLNKTDQKRVNQTFKNGVETFTEDDPNKVRENAEVAESESKYLGKQFESFRLMWSPLQDCRAGEYASIPWKLLASIRFAVTYLVSPIDIIPDLIPVLGFVDDAAVFALVVSAFQPELDDYQAWKKNWKS